MSAGFGLFSRAASPAWDAPRWPLFASLAVGAVWLAVAQASPVWATVLIWAMLLLALWALLRTPASDPWLLRAPVALYAGWLTAASRVAIGLVGAGYGIGPGARGWAVLCLLGALATTGLVLRARGKTLAYTAGVVWALVGVAVANPGEAWGLTLLSLAGATGLAIAAFLPARS